MTTTARQRMHQPLSVPRRTSHAPARPADDVPMTASLNLETFKPAVRAYLSQEDRVATLQAELSKVKRDHALLGGHVLSYMTSTNCKRCVTDHYNLTVSESMAQRSLTMDLVKDVLLQQFPGRPDMAELVCNAIRDYRKIGAGERVRLKRVKRRQPAA